MPPFGAVGPTQTKLRSAAARGDPGNAASRLDRPGRHTRPLLDQPGATCTATCRKYSFAALADRLGLLLSVRAGERLSWLPRPRPHG